MASAHSSKALLSALLMPIQWNPALYDRRACQPLRCAERRRSVSQQLGLCVGTTDARKETGWQQAHQAWKVGFWQIVFQKSFRAGDQNSAGLQARLSRSPPDKRSRSVL